MSITAAIDLAPVILVRSGEPVLGDRAIDEFKERIRRHDPSTTITVLDAASYSAHELDMLTSPSLFGESRAVIIPALESLNDALAQDLMDYLDHPEPDVILIAKHNGTVRGKKVLTAFSKAKVPTLTIAAVKKYADKVKLIQEDVRGSGRRMSTDAVSALIDALGSDLRELLAGVAQLIADTSGQIDVKDVHTYFSGRIEATGYNVADAALGGDAGKAIELARHALVTGASEVAIVAAIASGVREMTRVLGTRAARTGVLGDYVKAASLGGSSWQQDRAKKRLRGWSGAGLAAAVEACAEADSQVKGASRDSGYALEKLIISIARARSMR